jgi:SPP1 gp7 family putative phage head morphogenesis protein
MKKAFSQSNIWDNPHNVDWDKESELIQRALIPSLEETVRLGFAAGLSQINTGKSYEDEQDSLEEWAAQLVLAHAIKRAGDLNVNTERKLRRALELWRKSGGSTKDLELRLEVILGEARAEAIGVTEVTELFYKGEEEVWKRSKMVNELVWVTAADEMVCQGICAPLHGKTTILGMPFPGGYFPPAHVSCKCIAMVLQVGKDYL